MVWLKLNASRILLVLSKGCNFVSVNGEIAMSKDKPFRIFKRKKIFITGKNKNFEEYEYLLHSGDKVLIYNAVNGSWSNVDKVKKEFLNAGQGSLFVGKD